MIEVYRADCQGKKYNTRFPYPEKIMDDASAADALKYDYVCGEFKDHRRGKNNLLKTSTVLIDIDNDAAEAGKEIPEEEWLTPAHVRGALNGYEYVIHYSKSHEKDKKTESGEVRPARPKMHVAVAVESPITDRETYEATWDMFAEKLGLHPHDDRCSRKPEQMLYGTINPQVEYHSGEKFPVASAAMQTKDNQRFGSMSAPMKSFGAPGGEIVRYQQEKSLRWVREFISKHEIVVWGEEWQGDDYIIAVDCPWKEDHTEDTGVKQSAIIVRADGTICYNCFHGHCQGRGWREYRQFYEPEAYNDAELIVGGPQMELERTKDGGAKQSFKNGLIILRSDPELTGRFRFNELTQFAEFTDLSFFHNSTGVVNDPCLRAVREYVTFKYGLQSKDIIEQAVRRECERHTYNPVADLLRGLLGKWDGEDRFSTYLHKYLGVDISPYSTEVLKHTIFGVVSRTFEPGCKFDECLVLVGQEQGTGKSTTARHIALNNEWFWACKKLPQDLNKFYSNLQGCIVVELEEMAACRGVEIEVLRGLISEQVDVFDMKYQNRDRYPRRNIFIGTTNNLSALPRDPAGNRRFLPVLVKPENATARPYDPQEQRADTLQLYAQAMYLYENGQLLGELSEDVRETANEMREAFTPQDENQGALDAYAKRILDTYNNSKELNARDVKFSVLKVYNEVFNSGGWVKALDQKTQRQMVQYLDHCSLLQRYSGSKNHKCRVNGAVVVAWEFKADQIKEVPEGFVLVGEDDQAPF